GLEALATRHVIASELARDGQHAQAAKIYAELADDPVSSHPAAARRIAWLAAAWAATAADEPTGALAAHRRLVDCDAGEVMATHAWRALELASVLDDPAIGDLARAAVDASDTTTAERWVDALEAASPSAAMLARFEARGGYALRWAAMIAERLGNIP